MGVTPDLELTARWIHYRYDLQRKMEGTIRGLKFMGTIRGKGKCSYWPHI